MYREIRAGKTILDCSGPIHGKWIEKALNQNHAKVLVYRRELMGDEVSSLPTHDSFQLVSGELMTLLGKMKSKFSLIVDDLGSLHFENQPLELLKRYYDSLAWDGEALIHFPNSFWVFLEDQHRVSLQDYLTMKFPMLVKKIFPSEMDPLLRSALTSEEGWISLKKDHHFPKLFFHLLQRTGGVTSMGENQPHAPYLEFIETSAA